MKICEDVIILMMSDLRGDSEQFWAEPTRAAAEALEARLSLWSAIHEHISMEHVLL
jgi:hypothetical protein